MTKLSEVVIEVGGKKLKFSPEEAKELKAILSDLFGGDRVVEKIVERDYWHWWRPYRQTYHSDFSTGYITTNGSSWSVSANEGDGSVYLSSLSSSNS